MATGIHAHCEVSHPPLAYAPMKGRRHIALSRSAGTWRPAFLLTVSVLTVGCKSPFAPKPIQFTTEDWNYRDAKGFELASDHYLIRTTSRSKPFINALPGFLETSYQAYNELLPTETAPRKDLETYLFQTRWQWERFTEEFAPRRAKTYKRIRNGGYSERGVTVTQYSSRRATLSTLAHEGLHQFLEVTGRARIPAWINEGLACYFESFDLKDNRPVFVREKNTLRSPALREALAADALIPLVEILSTSAGQAIHKRSRHVSNYYAQEWSLVLFLLQSPATNPYYPGFRELLDELGTEAMRRRAKAYIAADTDGTLSLGEAVFRSYVTEDLATFESAYKAYLHELLDLKSF